ncbi:MAG: type I polyketide synthase [Pirellulaceae bacterium]
MENLNEQLERMTPLQRAAFALKETQARLDALEKQQTEPIAIIGMACRFPGGVNDPESYWRLLRAGVDAICETPPDRWDLDAYYDPDPNAPGKMRSRHGGFLKRIDEFDNHFFGVSDREAARIDPQQRMLLELGWEALEDAGLPPSALRGSRTSVFVGISISDYGMLLSRDASDSDAYLSTGSSLNMAANRISFAFDFRGPSLTTDTACSSSLVAIHLACQSLRNGESEMALVGGSTLMLSPVPAINLTKSGLLAADGRVRAFDAAASGYVRGEGAGVLVLKPLSAARKDNDLVYAVIRGSAVNQNGTSNGLTAPSRQAQENVLRRAYAQAKVSPDRVQYVEAQGTGTLLGDAIEAMALGNVLREGRSPGNRCALGSVKTNIGHLEAASGIASIMKVALALKHHQIPPSLHFQTPNPDIPFDDLPLKVQQTLEPWPNSAETRIAGVSANGFGGSNTHVVLTEAPVMEPPNPADPIGGNRKRLLPLSARTEKALTELVHSVIEFLRNAPPEWSDVCFSAANRRDHHDCRLAIVAASHGEAIDLLDAFLAGESRPRLFSGRKPFGRASKVAFAYGGQVEHWKPYIDEIAELAAQIPAAVAEIGAALERVAGWPLATVLTGSGPWDESAFALPGSLALQLTLTSWWRSLGVTPDLVLGQGVGELAAACTAGVLTQEEAFQMALLCGRGEAPVARETIPSRAAKRPYISSHEGQSYTECERGVDDWRQVVESSSNVELAIQAVRNRQPDFCLEIGPTSFCEWAIPNGLFSGHRLGVQRSLEQASQAGEYLLETPGALYAAGANLLWNRVAPSGRCVRLPTYPWQRQRLWALDANPFSRPTVPPTQPRKTSSDEAPASAGVRPVSDSGGDSRVTDEMLNRPDLNTPYVAPRSRMEEEMAQSWSEVLRVDRVGIYDTFFELGGDSLQATILLNRLQEQLGEVVQPHVLFHAQTVDELTSHLRSHYAHAVRRRYPEEQASLGETDGSEEHGPAPLETIPRLSRQVDAEEAIARLNDLTDDEVKTLLDETLRDGETLHE